MSSHQSPEKQSGGIVTITFDDCYARTLETVRPLLKEYDAPTTFFVPTEMVGTRWDNGYATASWDQLTDLSPEHELGSHTATHVPLPGSVRAQWRRLVAEYRFAEDRRAFFDTIANSLGVPSPDGNHQFDATRELVRSAVTIEREYGTRPASFAYPHGVWSRTAKRLVEAAGYELARTTLPGLNDASTDPLLLRGCMGSKTMAGRLNELAESAARESKWLVEIYHVVGDSPGGYEYSVPERRFREHLEYLDALDVKFRTLSSAAETVLSDRPTSLARGSDRSVQ